MKVVVTGASGFIGTNLIRELIKNHRVRGFVRETSDISPLPKNVEIFFGDMKDEESLVSALKNMDVVVHLAAATSEKASGSSESYKVNVDGAEKLVQACKLNNVNRLIVVSSQSTKRKRQGDYGQTKMLADKIFMGSSLQWTIFKPTLVYGPGSKGLFNKISQLVAKLPIIPIIGDGTYELQPTYIGDLVQAISSTMDNKNTFQKVYDLAGRSRMQFKKLLLEINQQLQQKKKFIRVPFWLCYYGVKLLSLITKNPPITNDNLLGLVQETEIDLNPAKKDFCYSPISFEEGMYSTIWGEDKDKLKVGVIGLGKMGVLHSSIINFLPNTKIVALFDVNPKIKHYVYSIGIKAKFYTNIDDFFKRDLDAVFISVPPSFTLPIIERCVEKGVSYFTEKPLASDLSKAKRIVDLTKKGLVKNSVGYMYAYKEITKKAKELISSGVLGEIKQFDASAYVTQVLSKKKGWRYQKSTAGGGCVSLHGTHLLYLIYNFFGLPKKVKSKLYYPFSEVEDRAFANIYYSSFNGTIRVSWSEEGYSKLTLKIIIEGNNGSMCVEDDKIVLDLKKEIQGYAKGKTIIFREDLPYAAFELGGEGYFSQDEDFINSISGKSVVLVNVEKAFDVQRMVQAIYDSAKKEVEL